MAFAVVMLAAILSGASYPPDGIPGTPANRALWDRITREVDEMTARGILPGIPGGALIHR